MRFRDLVRILGLSVLAAAVSSSLSSAQNRYFTFPQLAVGGGWNGDLFVNNQGPGTVSGVEVSFFDDDGNALNIDTQFGSINRRALTLAPGDTMVIQLAKTGGAQAGYAVLKTPTASSVRATLIVRYSDRGQVVTGVGVAAQGPFQHYSFAAEVSSSKRVNTGLALANAVMGSLNVDQTCVIALIREDGTLQDAAALSLNAGRHTSLFLDDPRLFPGLDDFRGTVSVSSPFPFGLLALRLDQAILSSVSVNYGPVTAPFASGAAPTAEVEPNDSAGQALMLTPPAMAQGMISSAGDVDFYRFAGNSGDMMAIWTEADAMGSMLDSVVTLLGPDGAEVASNDQSGLLRTNDSFLMLALPRTGTYSIEVEDYYGDGGAGYDYRLHVVRLGDGGGGGGGTLPGDLDGTWTGTTGQGMAVSFTIASNRLTTLRVAGRISGSGCTSDFDQTTQTSIEITDNPFSFTLPAGPGSVTLAISGSFTSSSMANGNVTMTLNAIPGVPSCSGSVQTTWSATKGGGGGGQPGLNGTWAGTTGQGFGIDFTVADNQITRVHFTGRTEAFGCSAQFEQNTETTHPITNNAFNFSVTAGPGGVSFTFSGTFTSSSMANGNLSMTNNAIPGVPSCPGSAQTTWTASKQ